MRISLFLKYEHFTFPKKVCLGYFFTYMHLEHTGKAIEMLCYIRKSKSCQAARTACTFHTFAFLGLAALGEPLLILLTFSPHL